MKVTVNFQLITTTLYVVLSCAHAQYPPSGYRPQGPQFTLPRRPASNFQQQNQYAPPQNQYGPPQNQYGPPPAPQNQYGAPDYRPSQVSSTVAPPPDQYLPADVRFNGQQDFSNQNSFNSGGDNERDLQDFQPQNYPEQTTGFGIASANRNPNLGGQNPSLNRKYLSPAENNFQEQRQQDGNPNPKQGQAVSRQLYQSPNNQELLNNNQEQNDDVTDRKKPKSNFGIASENYLPPTSTERRRYPESTTSRPDEEPDDSEAENPNVAIATAVARGQYYLLQPDGRLQKVLYKTTQTENDMKTNVFSAKLVYQPVEPITAPIYTYDYNLPLVSVR